ncbi:MAG: ketopantoate reductase family protein [Deltaproteobacteria bacterium]|nr:ketopantoate reductase family protein [Deltaproteobacteria bacterium]
MKVGVMGTGAIGGYFGGLLALSGVDTHFVARGKHYRAILEDGLHIVSSEKTHHVLIHVTAEPDEIGPVDLLLFCVKSYDTDYAAQIIEPMVEEDTVIISLQNGIDNQDKLSQLYGSDKVMAGTAFIEASIASPGVIAQMGKPGRIVFGELSGERTSRAEKILHLFQGAGIEVELSLDIRRVLWEKFLFICGIHGVSTLSRSPLGLVLAVPESRDLVMGVMKEVELLARRQGVNLPENAVENAMALAEGYNRNFKPSMLRDLEWRRFMELDALNGMVVKLGKQVGMETPLNHAIYACLNLENQKIANPVWAFQWEG